MKSLLALVFVFVTADEGTGAAERAACVGDCSSDGVVAVNELVIGINIALGNLALSACPQFDRDGNSTVGISELVGAVGSLLEGCESVGGSLRIEPVGGEFRVSAGTTGDRTDSQVAIDADGGFVAIWGATQTDVDDFGLGGRRFHADGMPATPSDFAVNVFTLDAQRTQDVAMQPDGSFFAVWETSGIRIDDADPQAGIYGRRFGTDGAPSGPDFKVNTFNEYREDQPSIAPLTDGGYFVAWTDRQNLIAGSVGVVGQRFGAAGQPIGEEFSVNAYTEGPQDQPAVAALPEGGFVIVWQDGYRDGFSGGIFGQRFDGSSQRVGGEFLVNTYTFSQQRFPAVAAAVDGSFLVAWASILVNDEQVVARHFDRNGAPTGDEFQVNAVAELGQQSYPSVAAAPDGGYLVAWESGGSIGPFNIYAQQIDHTGALVNQEFQVNTFTSNLLSRTFPEVAVNAAGDTIIVWEAQGQDGGTSGDVTIRGQRYRLIQ